MFKINVRYMFKFLLLFLTILFYPQSCVLFSSVISPLQVLSFYSVYYVISLFPSISLTISLSPSCSFSFSLYLSPSLFHLSLIDISLFVLPTGVMLLTPLTYCDCFACNEFKHIMAFRRDLSEKLFQLRLIIGNLT